MLNICANFHENWTCNFREITTNLMNKQTRPITISPGKGKKKQEEM